MTVLYLINYVISYWERHDPLKFSIQDCKLNINSGEGQTFFNVHTGDLSFLLSKIKILYSRGYYFDENIQFFIIQ